MPASRVRISQTVSGAFLLALAHVPAAAGPLSWTAKADMPTARHVFASGVLNGNIYAAGGYNGVALATVEAYDPATDAWTTKTLMPTARYGLAAGVVAGKLYAIGGQSAGYLSVVEA